MPKASKTQVCSQCHQEKVVAHDFLKGRKRCKLCSGVGVSRLCSRCDRSKPCNEFAAGKQFCKSCNSCKDTAEHVDVCEGEGCTQIFNQERFEWRGTSWRSKCRTCTNKPVHKPDAGTMRTCTRCGESKPAARFHGQECVDCRSEREKKHRLEKCHTTSSDTAAGKPCTKCSQEFQPALFKWQGDRWSSWCKSCFNNAAYYATWRAKKIKEDPVAYHAHQTACRAAYFAKRRAEVDTSFDDFVGQVKSHGRTWEAAEKMELQLMLLDPCHYCGYLPASGDPLNHLDRVDNTSDHYCIQTTVTSCIACNRIKGRWPAEDFLGKAKDVAADGKAPSADRREIDKTYRSYSSHATKTCQSFYDEQMRYVAFHNGYNFD